MLVYLTIYRDRSLLKTEYQCEDKVSLAKLREHLIDPENLMKVNDLFVRGKGYVAAEEEDNLRLKDIAAPLTADDPVATDTETPGRSIRIASKAIFSVMREKESISSISLSRDDYARKTLDWARRQIGNAMRSSDHFLIEGSMITTGSEKGHFIYQSVDSDGNLNVKATAPLTMVDAPPPTTSNPSMPSTQAPSAELPTLTGKTLWDYSAAVDGQVDDPLSLDTHSAKRLIEDNQLLQGLDISGNSPCRSLYPVAQLADGREGFVIYRDDTTEITSETSRSERQKNYVESGFLKAEAKIKTPWVGASLDGSYTFKDGETEKTAASFTTARWRASRAIVRLDLNGLSASMAFQDAVEAALDQPDQRQQFGQLCQVFRKFGHVLPTVITVGGELMYTQYESAEASASDHQSEMQAKVSLATKVWRYFQGNGGLAGGLSSNESESSGAADRDEQLVAHGGNSLLASSPGPWLASVGKWGYWRPISITGFVPTYQILPSSLRDQVVATLNNQFQQAVTSFSGFSIGSDWSLYAIATNTRQLWQFDSQDRLWSLIPTTNLSALIDVAALIDGSIIVSAQKDADTLSLYKIDSPQEAVELEDLNSSEPYLAPLPQQIGFITADSGGAGDIHLSQILHLNNNWTAAMKTNLKTTSPLLSSLKKEGMNIRLLSVATFSDGKVVVLIGEVWDSGQGHSSEMLNRNILLVFDGYTWMQLANDADLMSIAAGPDGSLVAFHATKVGESGWEAVTQSVFFAKEKGWLSGDICYAANWQESLMDNNSQTKTISWKTLDLSVLL